MPRYRALRDFGSHLGNHRRGDQLSLPDGPLPRGFDGLVEAIPEPPKDTRPTWGWTGDDSPATADSRPTLETKDVVPASDRASVAPADAGPPAQTSSGADSALPTPDDDPPAVDPAPPLQDDASAGYADKMIRDRNASKRRPS